MGKPVEVRVLSRAVSPSCLQPEGKYNPTMPAWKAGYFDAALLLAAQRAFISSDSLLRPAGVSAPFFLAGVPFLPDAFLLAAQRAFINRESFLRPAAVS
ncbi:MAG: hypothetical protein DME20_03130 [Verrucomicrobia bacterium]|nr:MAG: hypothetical protein DME74_04420 [Verrucomicrobiota bacterium]PYJ91465.1 MAG: hypothetical protein DME71_01985 [Verrucomicrobiota bacterium]PYK50984.1 MAG: hypothetical protein DME20_03130 [Verrucomicrobiota bacterium]